ncbi:peptidylprolyl isomerase [Geobacter pickeringii]|uniref:Peptidylprolyl isomerase n=1 Tax=Geobacter pickeringii TaxID=345632 RepID=A0A0B5BFN8_9BACT|nr:peptidylprolyl isomerase [Geobacter pickeringii]AJE02866.1 peptidylprolyl isomerase [Geobacter pickeringii]
MRLRRLFVYGFFMMLVLAVSNLVPAPAGADEGKDAKKVVAIVNDAPIYEETLVAHLAALTNKGKATGFAQNPKKIGERQRRKALDALIDAELLRQVSGRFPVADLDAKADRKLQELKGKFPSEEAFLKGPQMRGKTLDVYMAELRDGVRYDEYLASSKIIGIPVSDKEVEKFFRENQKSFFVPEQIKVRHILITLDGSTSDAVERAAEKAREIRNRLVREKDFAAVAKEASACASASAGGELGYVARGYMPPEFDNAAFSLKIGAVSEPVRTKYGFHLIEVLERKPGAVRPLPEVREFIARYLQRFDDERRLNVHTMELRKKATIKILLD